MTFFFQPWHKNKQTNNKIKDRPKQMFSASVALFVFVRRLRWLWPKNEVYRRQVWWEPRNIVRRNNIWLYIPLRLARRNQANNFSLILISLTLHLRAMMLNTGMMQRRLLVVVDTCLWSCSLSMSIFLFKSSICPKRMRVTYDLWPSEH